MSILVMTWAWAQDVPDASAKLVLLKLADNANDDGVCWPSQELLGKSCGLNERSVRYKIAKLAEIDLLTIEQRRRPDGSRLSNLYRIGTTGNPLPVADQPATACQSNRQQLAAEPSVREEPSSSEAKASSRAAPKSRKPRRPDLVWDVLVETFGEPSNEVERGRYNRATALLKESLVVNGVCTPEQVAALKGAIAAYPNVYPDAAWTPLAVASNWTTLVTAPNPHDPDDAYKRLRASMAARGVR